ncbi:MAG: GNAT family N-acetyltransferase [Nocardioides sp.]
MTVHRGTVQAPEQWDADVVLRDGGAAHLRAVRPDDVNLMVDFYARVSDESKYARFFSAMPDLSTSDLRRFTQVDHVDRVALVMMLSGQMIAVARYDRIRPGEAEVAFLVEDRQQGRGVAQVLLEHLAQAGRERGVERFVAEVLPENTRMLRILREAGYQVTSGLQDGVIMLEFAIDPTDAAVAVMRNRERHAEAASIHAFFHPKTIAVIGASRRPDNLGRALVRNLVTGDFTGRLYAVNPGSSAVSGLPAYSRVGEIPDQVDLAIIAVPAEAVHDVVLDCAAKAVRGLVIVSSGFAEEGNEGMARQRQLVGLARSHGLRLIGPNCLGVINTNVEVSLNASLAPTMPPRGRAGFFCQSGALGSAILEKVRNRGLGLSTFVSAGNRADVSANDLLQYWEDDVSTEVVLLYLESIGNPRKFSQIARRVSRRKPIIAVRSGRTTQGIPMGHELRGGTAAPTASSLAAADAMFGQAGVIQVDTLDEMFDVAQLLAHQPLPRGRRVAVVGNSHALGLLATDTAASVGLEVSKSVALGADANAEDFEDALDSAIDDDEVDAVIVVYIPPLNDTGEDVANVLAAVGEQSDKPLVSSFLGAEGLPVLLRIPDLAGATAGRGSVPSYPGVEAAARALAAVVEYATWLRDSRHPGGVVAAGAGSGSERLEARRVGKRIVADALADSVTGRDLSPAEVTRLLAAYEIDVWPVREVATLEEATEAGRDLGWNVVLKATADHLQRRPDLAHVWRSISSASAMAQAWQTLSTFVPSSTDQSRDQSSAPRAASTEIRPAPAAGFVVQRMAPAGVPVFLGAVEDPLFGPVVSFGLAGQLTELVGDRAYRVPPLTPVDAAALVRAVKAAPLLFGLRGAAPADVTEVERLVQAVARLQFDLPQIRSLELPLILAGEQGAAVLRATARVEPMRDSRDGWYASRLDAWRADNTPNRPTTDPVGG